MPDYMRVIEALKAAQRIAVVTHERPDGDAIGSVVGLVRLLRQAGKTAFAIDAGPLSERYRFLFDPDEHLASEQSSHDAFDCLAVLDCGALDRAPAFAADWLPHLTSINIDHHLANTGFATVNAVDTAASSVGEMITRLAEAGGYPLGIATATPLWVAIVTDTGRFAYDNTSPATLRIAASLLDYGLPVSRMDHDLFQAASETRLRIEARAAESLATAEDGRVAWIELKREDFAALHADARDVEDLVNIPRRLRGVEAALFFCERPDAPETKVSLRTVPPCDAAALCRQLGGGGHARAAGCTIQGDADTARAILLPAMHAAWFA